MVRVWWHGSSPLFQEHRSHESDANLNKESRLSDDTHQWALFTAPDGRLTVSLICTPRLGLLLLNLIIFFTFFLCHSHIPPVSPHLLAIFVPATGYASSRLLTPAHLTSFTATGPLSRPFGPSLPLQGRTPPTIQSAKIRRTGKAGYQFGFLFSLAASLDLERHAF